MLHVLKEPWGVVDGVADVLSKGEYEKERAVSDDEQEPLSVLGGGVDEDFVKSIPYINAWSRIDDSGVVAEKGHTDHLLKRGYQVGIFLHLRQRHVFVQTSLTSLIHDFGKEVLKRVRVVAAERDKVVAVHYVVVHVLHGQVVGGGLFEHRSSGAVAVYMDVSAFLGGVSTKQT